MDVHSPGAMLRRQSPRRLVRAVLLLSLMIGLFASVPIFSHLSAAHAAGTLLSQNQPATASSIENGGTPAADAVDGNTTTRWSSAASDPQWLEVDLGASASISQVILQWETAYGKAYQIQVSSDNATWTSIYSTTTGPGGTETLAVSGTGRYVRMYGTVRGTQYGYSLWEFQVYGTLGGSTCGTTNAALNQPATASSTENGGTPAADAVDGNTTTRWSSAVSDPQWLQVDLGASKTVCGVVLQWETAYGKAYQIQVSNDATTWTSIYSTTTGPGGTETLTVSGTGRYIRMYGTVRGTQYGYSLWEFQVFVTASGGSTPTPTSTPTSGGSAVVQLNAGGPAASPFIADADFSGGSTVVTANTIVTTGVTNAAPQAVYQSNREGNFSYIIPNLTANAAYTVRLHFAETYWSKTGQRTFNVSINGQAVLTSFDIVAAAGAANTAVVKQFGGTADATGKITIQFVTVVDNSLVSGIEVLSGGSTTPTPTPTPGKTPTPGTTPTPTGPTPTPTPGTNWTPVWSDNFAGANGSAPSAANWIEDTGTSSPGGPANWGTGEVETMSNSTSNVYLDGANHLNITAINTNGAWTSGRIETQRSDFAAPAGGMLEITSSLKQPNPTNGLGYWPAFWTLGAGSRSGQAWPGVGESDIMEDVNARNESASTLHCGIDPGGACNEPDGFGSGLATCNGCQTAYHTYTEIIDRTLSDEQIRWYIDGQQVWIVRESQVGVSTWQAAVDHGFFIIFDLAMGGAFPNGVCGCTSPSSATTSGGTLSIASVGVFQTTGTPPTPLTTPPTPTTASVVSVSGSQGNWQLLVNGAPYVVKGVTYGPPTNAALAYMPDLQSMGVNTVRTWGTDATTQPLLDAAAAYNIKVINGFWLNQGEDYLNDTTYKSTTLTSIQNWVTTYKNDPAVLMWDVGNEVILTMQNTYSGTQLEQERDAYAQYVEQVVQAIHAIDPYHPVTSTDAWTGAWPYYKTYTPDLDLYAVNAYGAACTIKQNWISGNYTKPYIVTESGPSGEWEVPNDANGVPTEPTDVQKSAGYATAWNCIVGHTGVGLGATLFNYGIENDFGGVWFNLITGHWRRLSYYSVRQLYGGQPATNTPPVISNLAVSTNNVPAGSQFTLSANVSDPNGDPLRYHVMLTSKYVDSNTALQNPLFTQTGATSFSVTAPQTIGTWKVYLYAYDGQDNVGIETISFKVVPPTVSGTNVAIGKTTTASSYQATGTGAPFPASNATDGNFTTRWASAWSDPQWVEVDLGSVTTLTHIQLYWESAYATAYQIQVSNDGTTWTTIYSTTTGDGGFDDFNVSGSGRYVRMYGTQRATTYGYSLYEFGIYS